MNNIKIVCLNLERKNDRKQEMIKKLIETGLYNNVTFMIAIDGNDLISTPELLHLFRNNNFNYRRGVMGCCLSHMNIYKQLLLDTVDYYLVIEDDVTFTSDFLKKYNVIVNALSQIKPDILYFGYSYPPNDILNNIYKTDNMPNIYNFNRKIYIGGTYGYIISKSAAAKILESININGIYGAADYLQFTGNIQLKIYETHPHIIYTMDWMNDNTSDIQHSYTTL